MNEEERDKLFAQYLSDFDGVVLKATRRTVQACQRLLPYLDDMRQHVRMYLWKRRKSFFRIADGDRPMSIALWMKVVVSRATYSYLRHAQDYNVVRVPKKVFLTRHRGGEALVTCCDRQVGLDKVQVTSRTDDLARVEAVIDSKAFLSRLKKDSERQLLMQILTAGSPTEVGNIYNKHRQWAQNKKEVLINKIMFGKAKNPKYKKKKSSIQMLKWLAERKKRAENKAE